MIDKTDHKVLNNINKLLAKAHCRSVVCVDITILKPDFYVLLKF